MNHQETRYEEKEGGRPGRSPLLAWMRHSLYLSEARLAVADRLILHNRMTLEEKRRLVREVGILVRVCMVETGEPLHLWGYELPWQRWARAHAALQVARHRGQIGEAEFFRLCDQAREERDKELGDGAEQDH